MELTKSGEEGTGDGQMFTALPRVSLLSVLSLRRRRDPIGCPSTRLSLVEKSATQGLKPWVGYDYLLCFAERAFRVNKFPHKNSGVLLTQFRLQQRSLENHFRLHQAKALVSTKSLQAKLTS